METPGSPKAKARFARAPDSQSKLGQRVVYCRSKKIRVMAHKCIMQRIMMYLYSIKTSIATQRAFPTVVKLHIRR